MNELQRHALIKKLIAKHTKNSIASRKKARATLIAEGIYTSDGALTAEYGGADKPRKTTRSKAAA